MSLDDVADDDLTAVELRCDRGHLLGESLIRSGSIVEGNLIQVSCRACRRADHPTAKAVLHQFNPLGEQIRTIIVP